MTELSAAMPQSPAEEASIRIVAARAHLLRAPTNDGVAMSFAPLSSRTSILVELETGSGLIGYGESWANFPAWIEHERLATLREGVFPLLIGSPVDGVEALRQRLVDVLEPIGRQWGAPGPIMQAISAVDIALWDLIGKSRNQSVGGILGQVRSSVAVYASSLGPEAVYAQAVRCREDGHRQVKVKVGFGRERDEAILEAARSGCGNGTDLYADANQAWTLDQGLEMAPVLRAADVRWIEEPLRGNRIEELAEFHRVTGIDIATGENLYGLADFIPYCRSEAVRVIQPDVTKSGGISEVMAICRMASAAGKTVIPHLYGGAVAFAATLQVAAAAPAISAIEYDIRENPLRDPVWPRGPKPVDGSIQIPTGLGLGVELDAEVVRGLIEDL